MTTTRGTRASLWDVAAALLVVAVSFLPFGVEGHSVVPSFIALWPVSGIVVAGVLVALPFRRSRPFAVLVVVAALVVAGWFAAGSALPYVAGLGIAVYTFTRATPRRRSLLVTVVLMAVLLGAGWIADGLFAVDPRIIPVPAILAFAAAAGDGTRSRRETLRAIEERAERAERTKEAEASRRVAEERLRIARDLHDAAAHQIAVISLQSAMASRALRGHDEEDVVRARAALDVIGDAARDVLTEIGSLMSVLRSDADESVSSPLPGLGDVDALVDDMGRDGLNVTVRREGDERGVPERIGRVAYAVVREGLANALKHGSGAHAHLLISVDGEALRVLVTNGVGEASLSSTGMGLVGLRERAASAGGTVSAGAEGGVHRLEVVLPVRQSTEEVR